MASLTLPPPPPDIAHCPACGLKLLQVPFWLVASLTPGAIPMRVQELASQFTAWACPSGTCRTTTLAPIPQTATPLPAPSTSTLADTLPPPPQKESPPTGS